MPVDLLQAKKQIREKSRQTALKKHEKEKRLEQARILFNEYSGDNAALIERVDKATVHNPGLRCAVPDLEPIQFTGLPSEKIGKYVIFAADGSQIVPSRHDRVEFGVINTGVFRMTAGDDPAQKPTEITRTRLLYGNDLENGGKPVTDDLVAMWRDLEERSILAELVSLETWTVFTLTDGPLELYHEPRQQEEFADLFQNYISELFKMAGMGAISAGYVDKPRADLVIRLLELAALDEKDLDQAGRYRPFAGVTDMELFDPILKPGQRTAVFRLQSISARSYPGDIGLHFFYLNAGAQGHPAFSRVEIPAWVARNSDCVGQVHAVLVEQCKHLGARPYPYALHRAHEIAVVGREEKQALEDMIVSELYHLGLDVEDQSYKQIHKDQSGIRTRYKK